MTLDPGRSLCRWPGRRPSLRLPRLEVEQLEDRCLLSGGNFTVQPIIPAINPGMKAYLQSVLLRGLQLGNRLDSFAKVGDSITAFPQFLYDLGNPAYNPYDLTQVGWHTDLASTLEYYRYDPVDGTGANSFNHVSWAAAPGWRAVDLLNPAYSFYSGRSFASLPYETPLATEFRLTRPTIALIMVGTNDLMYANPESFRAQLMAVASTALNNGVIPVLSTLPDIPLAGAILEPQVAPFNQVIVDVADALDVPLWNYWAALQALPSYGMSTDGVHPSVDPQGSGLLTDQGLLFGYNMRNFTAVEVLDKLRRVVINNGPPDPPDGDPSLQTYEFVVGLYQTVLGRVPDSASLQGWALFAQDLSRQQLAQIFWRSAEHRALQVDQYYVAYLHRHPSDVERTGWVNAFGAGLNEEDIQHAFLTSTEYQATHASDEAFVAGLYQDVFGRDADAGQAGWVQNLQNGESRQALLQTFLNSDERYERALDTYYATFFRRPAAPGEELGWLLQLQAGATRLELVGENMLTSYEFWVIPH